MLKILPKFPIALLAFLIIGCSTVYKIGKEFDLTNISKIKIGVTTQQDIINYFGQPYRKGIANGDEVYYYTNEQIIFEKNRNVKKEGNSLLIEFDSNSNVKNYYLNVPGKETLLMGYIYHKLEMEKKLQNIQGAI